MSAAPTRLLVDRLPDQEPLPTTLLDLVRAIGEVTEDDREVVATVRHLLETGRVRLTGNFSGIPIEVFR